MISIRKSTADDIPFIKSHAYRLLEFGPPSWREEISLMTEADIRHNTNAILSNDPDIGTFIAVDDEENQFGWIYLTIQTDYYTKERHAHITDIVVAKDAEGKGIGKALLAFADEWAKEMGSRWITLNVFAGNQHAQAVYEKAGYQKEWVKYLKILT